MKPADSECGVVCGRLDRGRMLFRSLADQIRCSEQAIRLIKGFEVARR